MKRMVKRLSAILMAAALLAILTCTSFAAARYSIPVKAWDFSQMSDADLSQGDVDDLVFYNSAEEYGSIEIDGGQLVLTDTEASTNTYGPEVRGAYTQQTGDFSVVMNYMIDSGSQYIRIMGRNSANQERMITNLDLAADGANYNHFIYSQTYQEQTRFRLPDRNSSNNYEFHKKPYTLQMDVHFASQTVDYTIICDGFIGKTPFSTGGYTFGVLNGNVYTVTVPFAEAGVISSAYIQMKKTRNSGVSYFDGITVTKAGQYNLSGAIYDENNAPLSGAAVRIYAASDSGKNTVEATVSGSDGGFAFNGVYEGSYVVEATKAGYTMSAKNVELNANVSGVALKLNEGGVLFEDFNDKENSRNLSTTPIYGMSVAQTYHK